MKRFSVGDTIEVVSRENTEKVFKMEDRHLQIGETALVSEVRNDEWLKVVNKRNDGRAGYFHKKDVKIIFTLGEIE